MLEDVVLHDPVVLVRVDPDVRIGGEGIVHDGGEHAVDLRQAGDAVDDVVGKRVVQPLPVFDIGIGRFRRGHEGEVADDTAFLRQDTSGVAVQVLFNVRNGGVAVHPLIRVAAVAHDALGCVQDGHDGRDVCFFCDSYFHDGRMNCLSGVPGL